MSVNGVTNSTSASTDYTSYAKATKGSKSSASAAATVDSGVTYEPSTAASKTYTPDQNLIARLKADSDAKVSQLKNLVEQMMTKQGNKANDIWSFLSKGNFDADPAAIAKAKEEIGENGYWGVQQTSDRILDFAKALTGGDPDKIEKMKAAFEKGYKAAEKTWGGKLPDICKQTYDKVLSKFDEWAAAAKA